VNSRKPLQWRAPRTLPAQPPPGGVVVTDSYDWWHFRRLGAHEPGLFARLSRGPELVSLAFDLYAALYKPRLRIRDGTETRLSAAIGYLLEKRGVLAALRRSTVLNEWATIVALPALLTPLLDALKRARKGGSGEPDEPGAGEAAVGAGAAVAAQVAANRAVGGSLTAYEAACSELAAFDAANGLSGIPGEESGASRPLSRNVAEPPLRRVGLPALLRSTGRSPLLAERTRLTRNVRTHRAAVQAARKQRRAAGEPHALAVAHGEDPAMNEAAVAAKRAVEESMALVEAVQQLFERNDQWGRGRGGMYSLPLDTVMDLGRMLQKQPALRRIIELAGRWSLTLKRRVPRGHSTLGRREVVGVEVGGDIHRLLPSELSLLGRSRHPALRRLTLARLAERRALLWQLRGPHLLGRGPVIVVVDTSGSMDGPRVVLAKGLVLALALRCWEKRRPLHVLTFGAPGELSEISFRPGDDFGPRLRACLRLGYGGGTDFDGPLQRVVELCSEKPWSQADAVFITDGYCDSLESTRASLAAAKRARDLEIIGLLLAQGRGLEGIADHVFVAAPGEDDGVPETLLHRLAGRL